MSVLPRRKADTDPWSLGSDTYAFVDRRWASSTGTMFPAGSRPRDPLLELLTRSQREWPRKMERPVSISRFDAERHIGGLCRR